MTAPAFVRMSQVTPEWANRDFHLHTRWTDGKPAVADVVRRCEELGLAEIAFTEHVRKDSDWFSRFADEVREASAKSRVRVFVGCEVRIEDFEGTLDVSDEIRGHCDVVLASVHRFPGADGERVPFSQVPKDQFAPIEHRLAMAFLRRGGAAVLAHPGGMSLRYGNGFPEECYLELAETAKAAGIAIELNASYLKDFSALLPLLRRVDPAVSVGSDAHDLHQLGAARDRLRALL